MVNGKQIILVWYVDKNKVSHMEETLVEDLIHDLEKHFGKLLVTRGKKHTFWDISYSQLFVCEEANIINDEIVRGDE